VIEAALELTRASLDLRLRRETSTARLGTIRANDKPDASVSAVALRHARQVGDVTVADQPVVGRRSIEGVPPLVSFDSRA
jgi:hypothetical protein